MNSLRSLSGTDFKYDRIVGTGGIGSGIFFSLKGNETLGRNESRMANLLPCKDFCKQHIILHYVAVLLQPKANKFKVFPIGKVGNDTIGKELIGMMEDVGMNTRYVSASENCSTLFSVCYQYPDNSGGNITTENSASGDVSPNDISQFFYEKNPAEGREIILAAPEVPLNARIKLLEFGRRRRSLNVASVLSSEVNEFKDKGCFRIVDILSINIDEAKNIAGIVDEAAESKIIVEACIADLVDINPKISVLITDGASGSYCYHDNYLEFTPVPSVLVKSTAGAGDAFLAGVIAGLCCGLSLTKGISDKHFSETPISSAVELGTMLASLSVTSPDTIHPTADAGLLYKFASQIKAVFSEEFLKIFVDCV